MSDKNINLALSLLFSKGIGISNSRIVYNIIGNNNNFNIDIKNTLHRNNFNVKLLNELFSDRVQKLVENEIYLCKKNNIDIIPFWSDKYPFNLTNCNDAPILLFQKGNINWNSNKIISIVGTRNMTNYGKKNIHDLILGIKKINPIILSGLAFGVDIESHKSAIENNLHTVAILGSGIGTIYPNEHKTIAENMIENGGICSEFPFNTPPMKENFPKRNRIIAGICDTLIIIESKISGGSIITANIANSYNKDIFAIPGRLNDKYSQGCNFLIEKNIANIYNSNSSLEHVLNWQETKISKVEDEKNLSEDEKKIISELTKHGKIQIDQLAKNLNLNTFQITHTLLELELKGIIQSLPGKIFSII